MKVKELETGGSVDSSLVNPSTFAFGIDDPRVIFTILRDKMYSNPKKATIQEYLSNARDAHREVGKGDIPIEVYFPDSAFDDCQIRIRDYGPGIQPWDIAGIFVKYGNSTKRESDDQTGGWGLGCKTGFAIGDSFQVISITPDIPYTEDLWRGDNPTEGFEDFVPLGDDPTRLVRRVWYAYIGDDKLGDMTLLSESLISPELAQKKENQGGLEIILPIDDDDINTFANHATDTMQFWPVRAKVYNKHLDYASFTADFEGDGWSVLQDRHEDASIILDGIRYPINDQILEEGGVSKEALHILRKSVMLYFKCGEILPIPNREDISYDSATIDKISARLELVTEYIRKSVQAEFAKTDAHIKGYDYIELCIRYRELKDRYGFNRLGVNIETDLFKKREIDLRFHGDFKVWRASRNQPFKVVQLKDHRATIPLHKGVLIAEDCSSTKKPSAGRVASIFDVHLKIENVYIVRISPSARKIPDESGAVADTVKYLDKMFDSQLSDYKVKKKTSSSTGTISIPKIKVFCGEKLIYRIQCVLPEYRRRENREDASCDDYAGYKPYDGDPNKAGGGPFVILHDKKIYAPKRTVKGGKVFIEKEEMGSGYCSYASALRSFFNKPGSIKGIFWRWVEEACRNNPKWITPEQWAILRFNRIKAKYPYFFRGNTIEGWQTETCSLFQQLVRYKAKIKATDIPPGILRKYFEFHCDSEGYDKVLRTVQRLKTLGAPVKFNNVKLHMDKRWCDGPFKPIMESEFCSNVEDMLAVLRLLHRNHLKRIRKKSTQTK